MDGLSYNKKSIFEKYDNTPTQGSTNLVNSGNIKNYVDYYDGILNGKLSQLENQVTNPFKFKGDVSNISALPSSGNTLNDTWYVQSENCLYSWNGSTWKQSSLDETDYLDIINGLKSNIASTFDPTKSYEINSVVLYNNDCYRCKSAVIPGPWTGTTNWSKMTLGDILYNYLSRSIHSSEMYLSHSNLHGYTDANNFPANVIMAVSSDVIQTDIANLPVYSELAYIITTTVNIDSVYSAQIYYGRNTFATRIHAVSGWTAWSQKANYNEVMKYLPITQSDYTSIAEIPEGTIFVINVETSTYQDAPTNALHGFLMSSRVSASYKIQIFYENNPRQRIWWRIVNRTTSAIWLDWVASLTSEDLNQLNADVNKYIQNVTNYRDTLNITNLSEINDNVIFLANNTVWADMPVLSGIFKNTRYSLNYNIQELYRFSTGQMLIRIVDRRDGSVYNDWKVPNNIEATKVLSMGDSICYGARNNHKGFLGDLHLSRKDVSWPGARLSNTRISEANHFCIYQQFIDFVSDVENANYYPDILIADGGINDYGADENDSGGVKVNLGDIPVRPVQNDTEAQSLDKSTLCGSLQYLFYNWIKYYPLSQRFFVLTHRDKSKPWTKNYTTGYTQTEMNEAISKVCNIYGVVIIDVFNRSILNSAFSQYISPTPYSQDSSVTNLYCIDNDGVHPLALGYQVGYIPLVKEALHVGTAKELNLK